MLFAYFDWFNDPCYVFRIATNRGAEFEFRTSYKTRTLPEAEAFAAIERNRKTGTEVTILSEHGEIPHPFTCR